MTTAASGTTTDGPRPKLLLHVCCGPCATEVIRRLHEEYEIVGFFHNPNIWPEEEYGRRLLEVQRLSALWHVLVDVGLYDHEAFLAAARGMEGEPEGGQRCATCFRLRLEAAAEAALANGCSVVASTLTIGRNKRAETVNAIGREACAPRGLRFLEADWKKQGGEQQSAAMSKELGMYRQHYCGCEFSRRGREH
ncbi:MAG: epoxyqueuosine reductase QueH [bacterium]